MIQPMREWLPASALTSERIDAALRSCIEDWCRRWFASEGVPLTVKLVHGVALAQEGSVTEEGDGVRLVMPAGGKRVLLEQVLGESLAGKQLSASDHRLLDGLAHTVARDLVAGIEKLMGPPPSDGSDQLEFALHSGQSQLFRLACPVGPVIRLIKSRIVPACLEASAFATRYQAIAPSPLRVEAVLGRAELSVDDLHNLEPGDVLVLDAPLTDPATLRVFEGRHHIGKGHLSRMDQCNAVIFQS